jgi:DNA mismatch repair protein MutS
MMEQYRRIKREHPDRILLYRMGDFYETFFEDAVTASKVLGITLTTRGRSEGQDVPLAGVPYHAVNSYINRLLKAGHSVAVCEQVEDPALAKGVVRREVVEVITPGTVAIEEFLPAEQGSYCLALLPAAGRDEAAGFALGDVSTGELLAGQDAAAALLGLPVRFRVQEILYPEGRDEPALLAELRALYPQLHFTPRRGWDWSPAQAEEAVRGHFGVSRSALVGLREGEAPMLGALGALLGYLHELKGGDLGYFDRIQFLRDEDAMALDRTTVENLELLRPLRGEEKEATLFAQINLCVTPMGARLLARWLLAPLLERSAICERQAAVAELKEGRELRDELVRGLRRAADLERLVGRLDSGPLRPRDLGALAATLALLPAIQAALEAAGSALLAGMRERIAPLAALRGTLERALVDELPAKLGDGPLIAEGFDEEMDRLRRLARDGRGWILALQEKERERTGLGKLRIGYNKVFGYYLELGKSQADKVPADYILKQQLAGSFRYITPELKSREEEILGAEEKLRRREAELGEELRRLAYAERGPLQENARCLAALDCLACLAALAEQRRYCRPEIVEEPRLSIREGRHPVVEALQPGAFIPNDLDMDARREQIHLITGPNMGGKSTFLRQTALAVIMAQMGGFVPASSAVIGIADKIFTRVGASDNLARGQSTFLIEMEETAAILRNLTGRSLVVMDEIGRGTSTYDGLSLAWAVVEHLHRPEQPHARTLFATHYHELTRLEGELDRLANYHVTVKEWQDSIVFLRKVARGAAGRSYGIQVAKLAGLPAAVIERASQLLRWIEQNRTLEAQVPSGAPPARAQMDLFARRQPAFASELKELDLDGLSPREALDLLARWQADLKREE